MKGQRVQGSPKGAKEAGPKEEDMTRNRNDLKLKDTHHPLSEMVRRRSLKETTNIKD